MESLHTHLVLAFRKILRPLMRLAIRIGLRYDEFTEILKGAYIESAVRDGLGKDVPITRPRIVMATGLPRREVDRFLEDTALLQPAQSLTSVVTMVLHMWSTEPLYLGPYGLPLEIRFDRNPSRCIVDLVRRASPGSDPHEIIESLISAGAVIQNEDDTYRVIERSYMVTNMMSASGLELFGNTLSHLANTFEHNLQDSGAKLLQRSVVADQGLPVDLMPEFQAFLNKRVQAMLIEVDDWIGGRVGVEVQADRPRIQTGVSVFHYIEPDLNQSPLLDRVHGETAPRN
jgi:hypothetical protein